VNRESDQNEDLNSYYRCLRKNIRRVANGFFNCCFIHGKPGIGKSVQVEEELKEKGLKLCKKKGQAIKNNKKNYVVFCGAISSAFLYRYLYEHNGKVIIFRDMEKKLNSIDAVNIFRSATDSTEPRTIQKATYSKNDSDLPRSYQFVGKIIFEMNSLSFRRDLKEEIESLIYSRGNYRHIMFCREEIESIMRIIAKTKEDKEVTEFLIKNFNNVGWNRFDLRTQKESFQIYKDARNEGEDWKKELLAELKATTSRIRQMLYPHIGKKIITSYKLKKLMLKNNIDNCYSIRTADRRIKDYIIMQELFIPDLAETADEEKIEQYLNTHRKYSLTLDPIRKLNVTSDTKMITPQRETSQTIQQVVV